VNCPRFEPFIIRCPGSGSFGRRLWKNRFAWLVSGLLIGSGVTSWYTHRAMTWEYQARIAGLNAKIANLEDRVSEFRKSCVPIDQKRGKVK
jgi:hypothetical protein